MHNTRSDPAELLLADSSPTECAAGRRDVSVARFHLGLSWLRELGLRALAAYSCVALNS